MNKQYYNQVKDAISHLLRTFTFEEYKKIMSEIHNDITTKFDGLNRTDILLKVRAGETLTANEKYYIYNLYSNSQQSNEDKALQAMINGSNQLSYNIPTITSDNVE